MCYNRNRDIDDETNSSVYTIPPKFGVFRSKFDLLNIYFPACGGIKRHGHSSPRRNLIVLGSHFLHDNSIDYHLYNYMV
ncbi:hypothetical protein CR513_12856, partial [Mucuna pruriens]